MNELTVKYKNDLNTIPMRSFNRAELDLFFSICAKMKNKQLQVVELSFDDLKSISRYSAKDKKRFIQDVRSVNRKLLKLNYSIENKDMIADFNLFNTFKIYPNENKLEVSINSDFSYILNELSNEFTQFELQEFTSLKSSYSKTVYRLLKQFKSTGFYTVKIDEFKKLLDIPASYKMSDIDKKVFSPIKKELSAYFEPFEIKKIKAKKGNRIDRLEFIFFEKIQDEKIDVPKVTLHNWVDG